MGSFIFKLIFFGFIGWVIYMIVTGNMGGAQDATANYNKVLQGSPAATESRQ